ncbi:MAG: Mrp/NBP35 family ATP-binding protein [Bacteroidales bacterium]|nr:Mrp/NBP35 family ATP-binding protein [Bacteroidales bacterium]MCI2121660.1 Mrp/NBP35 family ATP-binding protein [Bacteroidales bacterium]MCI2144974.1 Mrp/NBP35 family ATP-binding protein [Bacteroidales bacterium]
MTKEEVLQVLSQVIHPAKGIDIVDLGRVEDLDVVPESSKGDPAKVRFKYVTFTPDPMAAQIKQDCTDAIQAQFPGTKVSIIELVRPKDAPKSVKLPEGQEELENVGKMIAVASGKGGVGKSTVAVNLAVALANMGYRVGLADADVYGPSVPKMTGTEGAQPDVYVSNEGKSDQKELIMPIEKYGVKWMSIGYFAKPEQALIWRGPMACNALKQMILQVRWDALDYLLIDLPPGTGDIHISLVQDMPLTGALIVSTPQDVALADVEKSVNLFRNEHINKRIIGLVENMAYFTPEDLPDRKYYIFGKGGCEKLAGKYGFPLLGQIPLVQGIREGGDEGVPSSVSGGIIGDAFTDLAKKLVEEVGK